MVKNLDLSRECPSKLIATAQREIKLDLACGQSCREGYEGVDRWEGAKHQLDLLKFPWPWKDSSVEALHSSHFVEHIPHGDGPKDLFFSFFDECWRILKPGATMEVITPCARNNRAFQDPTHRRFIVAESFLYLNRDWRKANKLDHYSVLCDFDVNVDPALSVDANGKSWMDDPEVALRSDAVKNQILNERFNHQWNRIADWSARLRARK